MPFKSEKQRRWMFANKPEMAKRWAAEYKNMGGPLSLMYANVGKKILRGADEVPEIIDDAAALRKTNLERIKQQSGRTGGTNQLPADQRDTPSLDDLAEPVETVLDIATPVGDVKDIATGIGQIAGGDIVSGVGNVGLGTIGLAPGIGDTIAGGVRTIKKLALPDAMKQAADEGLQGAKQIQRAKQLAAGVEDAPLSPKILDKAQADEAPKWNQYLQDTRGDKSPEKEFPTWLHNAVKARGGTSHGFARLASFYPDQINVSDAGIDLYKQLAKAADSGKGLKIGRKSQNPNYPGSYNAEVTYGGHTFPVVVKRSGRSGRHGGYTIVTGRHSSAEFKKGGMVGPLGGM